MSERERGEEWIEPEDEGEFDYPVEFNIVSTPNDFNINTIFDFIASGHHEKASAVFKELLEKGSLKVQEFKVVANNGTKKDIDMSLAIMKDADGKPIGLVAISRDVHKHKKTK